MARGEKIGDAYVRIHADGKGMDKELKKSLSGLSEAYEKAGGDNAKTYEEAFRKERFRQSKVTNKEVLKGFDENIARMAARVDRASIPLERSIQKRFRQIFDNPTLARIATDNLMRDIADGFRSIGDQNLFEGLESQIKQAGKDLSRMMDDAIKENEKFNQKIAQDRDRAFDADLKRFAAEAAARQKHILTGIKNEQLIEDFRKRQAADEKRRAAESVKLLGEQRDGVLKLDEAIKRLAAGQGKLGESNDTVRLQYKELTKTLREYTIEGEENNEHLERARADLAKIGKEMRVLTPRTARLSRRFDLLGDSIGAVSGRGSRNNFLNFIGSVNRNITKLAGRMITLIPKSVGFLKNMVTEFGNLKEAAGGGFKGSMQALLGVTGGIFSTLATGLPGLIAAVAGFAALAVSAGVLAAVLSGLLGIITALVAVVTFGLIGALSGAIALLLPLAAGIGIVVAGIKSLNSEQKKAVKEGVKPLTESLKALGDIAAAELFKDVPIQAKNLSEVFKGMKPLVRGVSESIRSAFTEISETLAKSAKDPKGGVYLFTAAMSRALPDAIRQLTIAGSNFAGGFGGIFRAMAAPGGILERTVNWISEIAETFNKWANSTKGQKQLFEFFETVGDAAADVGDFLKEATLALAALFDGAEGSGAKILTDLGNALADFTEWLTSPEGKKAMKEWMEFAEDFAKAIGEAGKALIDLFDTLDSPSSRSAALGLVNGFTAVVTTVDRLLEKIGTIPGLVALAFPGLAQIIVPFSLAWQALDAFTDDVADKIRNLPSPKDIFKSIIASQGVVLRKLGELNTKIGTILQPRNIFNAIRTTLSAILTDIGNLIARIPGIPSPKNVLKALSDTASKLVGYVEDLISLIPGVPSMPDFLSGVYSTAQSLLRTINEILDQIGKIKVPGSGGGGIGGFLGNLNNFTATGGIFEGARGIGVQRRIGEAGAEAVVPLDRNLSQVDPSVRALSALAQGKIPGMASGGVVTGRSVNVPEINVYEVADGKATAQEILNRLVATGY